jgi:hypothetical protein
MSLLIAYATNKRAMGKGSKRCITILDECWALLQSPSLGPVIVQLFRTARKRDACGWGLSQAVEDFTGTLEKPNDFGGAILTTTAIHRVKHMGMTEKGEKNEFLLVIGEKSETTHSIYIITTPIEYWLLTTFLAKSGTGLTG